MFRDGHVERRGAGDDAIRRHGDRAESPYQAEHHAGESGVADD